jgi:general secretion pathway protein J
MIPARRGELGFSMIETLIALAILGLVLSVLPSTVRLGQRAWEARADIETRNAVPGALGFLEQRLSEARATLIMREDGALAGSFIGTPRSLSFAAPEPPSAPGGLYLYRLSVASDGTEPRLVLTAAPLESASTATPLEIFAVPVSEATFAYFGRSSTGTRTSWSGEWTARDVLPRLVEIVVRVGAGPRTRTHRIVVEPKLAATG